LGKGEIMWWKGIAIFFGCIGTMVLSVMMLIHIGSETDPGAIFFFFVFAAAAGVLILLFGDKNFLESQPQPQPRVEIVYWEPPVQSPPVQRPPQKVDVVDRGVLQPKRPRPIPMNFKK